MIVEHRFAHIPQDARRGRAWVASLAPLMEARLDHGARVPVGAFHRYRHLGEMILGDFEAPAQTTERPESLVIRQALDHLVLRTHFRGRARIDTGGSGGEIGPGDIVLLDLAHAIRIDAEPSAGVELILPRLVLADGAGRIELQHGKILGTENPMTRLVADHLRNLAACLPVPDPAAQLVAATLALCRAILAHSAESTRKEPGDPTIIAIRRFIEANLATVDVSTLMDRFGLSQRSLYRLFPDEGVSTFIRDRRLAQAMRTLARLPTGARPPKLARLAYDCGFADPRVFSRAFRRRYGILPAEARAGIQGADDEATLVPPLAWLRAL
ncbi:AraC family transcriptional regulator [Methylobacterium sp. D54C]